MQYSVNIPNFGDFADVRAVVSVAEAAEQSGWDGLFIWDHVVHDKVRRRGQPFGDPWMLLTAAALSTSKIKLGPLLTPVARRRPEQLARQVATLDQLSNGRVIFGAGLGAPIEDEFGSFGDSTDARVLAERLDEGLDLLNHYWSGDRVDHDGKHYQVNDVTLLPSTVQQPRPPVWIGGYWPNKAPMRRAARWDGVVPLFKSATHGVAPDPAEVTAMVNYVQRQRGDDSAFEFVVGGSSSPDNAGDTIGPLADAGATWWDERNVQGDPAFHQLAPVLERVRQGPPRL